MAEPSSRSSHPPSEPRSARTAADFPGDAGDGRPPERHGRGPLLIAVVVGLALVGVQLYLWRRPRAARETAEAEAAASARVASAATDGGAAGALGMADAAPLPPPPLVTLSDPRILECHDPGPRKTLPEQCDRLPPLEQAFAKAIEQAAPCVPTSLGGGTIVYALDVSFLRKRKPFLVTTPKDGRTFKSGKVVTTCAESVKRVMSTTALDAFKHGHARYKLAITATYPPPDGALTPR